MAEKIYKYVRSNSLGL